MQTLAAYSFDTSIGNPQARLLAIDRLIDKWLIDKKVTDPNASDGEFGSKSGDGSGQFSRRQAASTVGLSREVVLIETTTTGEMFTTNLQVAQTETTVSVYATLGATMGNSVVAPLRLTPRCPWIIRALILEFNDWQFCGQSLPIDQPFDATTTRGVRDLCHAIRDPSRRLPLLVVSNDTDEEVWPDVAAKAADQLIGLADVAYVDEESSWTLTDELGPQNSCYLGAVRLYWPVRRVDGIYEGITWVAHRLAQFGDGDFGRGRFLSALRRTIMLTAAHAMVPPAALREIQSAVTRARLASLEAEVRERELNSIIEENTSLEAKLLEAQGKIAELNWKLSLPPLAIDLASTDNAATGTPSGLNKVHTPPVSGEVRYYKKIGSGGGIDSLVVMPACNHRSSNWKPAFKGDQAEKGILRLEGRNDWQSIAHCSACKGGGRWRIQW